MVVLIAFGFLSRGPHFPLYKIHLLSLVNKLRCKRFEFNGRNTPERLPDKDE
jgi:hypothetical protein